MNTQALNQAFDDDTTDSRAPTIQACIAAALHDYFQHLEDYPTTGLYDLMMEQVEPPLLEAVLEHCRGNQTKAAQLLGINRGTLRKKLKLHNLLDE